MLNAKDTKPESDFWNFICDSFCAYIFSFFIFPGLLLHNSAMCGCERCNNWRNPEIRRRRCKFALSPKDTMKSQRRWPPDKLEETDLYTTHLLFFLHSFHKGKGRTKISLLAHKYKKVHKLTIIEI